MVLIEWPCIRNGSFKLKNVLSQPVSHKDYPKNTCLLKMHTLLLKSSIHLLLNAIWSTHLLLNAIWRENMYKNSVNIRLILKRNCIKKWHREHKIHLNKTFRFKSSCTLKKNFGHQAQLYSECGRTNFPIPRCVAALSQAKYLWDKVYKCINLFLKSLLFWTTSTYSRINFFAWSQIFSNKSRSCGVK